jgi:myo-inositol-1-phosphate synthase
MAPHAEESGGRTDGFTVQTAPKDLFVVNSPNVEYTDDTIKTKYTYRTTDVSQNADGKYVAVPKETVYDFQLDRKIPKLGVMLVGLGGNNGTTVTAGIIANKRNLVWETKQGKRGANYYGSVIMSSTTKLGVDSKSGKDIYIPFHDLLPMVHPNDLVVGGWDISGMNLADAMDRAKVLSPSLKSLVRKEMSAMKPLPSIYYPDFIAANQEERADNVIPGTKASMDHVEQIRKDIREFKAANGLDKVIVQWTANTERFAELVVKIDESRQMGPG